MDFRYEAVNAQGQVLSGVLVAPSETDLLQLLRQQGLTPVAVTAVAPTARRLRFRTGKAPSTQAVLLVVRELATLLAAGVSLAEAVDATRQAYQDEAIVAAFGRMHAQLRAGAPLSEALRAAELPFPEYVYQLVGAGELTGKLAEALRGAADQMEYEERVREEMRSALVYPSVLVFSGIAATLLMFVVVVPKFSNMLKSSRAELPDISRWVLQAGLFAKDHLFWLIAGSAALLSFALLGLRNPRARQGLLEFCARLPIIGEWLTHTEVGRWATMLGTLLANKVPVVRALELASTGVRLKTLTHSLQLVQRDLRAGQKLADALGTHQTVNAMGINLVRVGERTGELPSMLLTLGQIYEQASRARMKRFLVLLEPITILLVGSVIGFIMIAIMLAITSMSSVTF